MWHRCTEWLRRKSCGGCHTTRHTAHDQRLHAVSEHGDSLQRTVSAALLIISIIAVAVVALSPPVVQPLKYHQFADTRAWIGVPNFLNVMSNVPFLWMGVAGLRVLARRTAEGRRVWMEHLPWVVLMAAVAATGFGSAYYHLAPDNASLFWDRLPMSIAFAALVTGMVTDRWTLRRGNGVLVMLVAVGVGTVVWWRVSASLNTENVLPYFVFQAWSLLVVTLLYSLPARYSHGAYLVGALGLYGLAMVAELLDRVIYSWGQIASGHTLKHVLAAGAIYLVVRLLRRRRPAVQGQ